MEGEKLFPPDAILDDYIDAIQQGKVQGGHSRARIGGSYVPVRLLPAISVGQQYPKVCEHERTFTEGPLVLFTAGRGWQRPCLDDLLSELVDQVALDYVVEIAGYVSQAVLREHMLVGPDP